MFFTLPFIGSYSATVQLSVLATLLLFSYLHRGARLVIGGTALAYLGFKILVPVLGWILYIFKGLAWFGFYFYFFKKAITYIATAGDFILNDGLEAIIKEMGKKD